jgi:methyl-accepting chemotaxis protein
MTMKSIRNVPGVERSWLYACCGFILGIFAPLGWMTLRLLLFWQQGQPLWHQVINEVLRSAESVLLYCYMGGGTALVLAVFGFIVGKGTQQIHERAARLDQLNGEIATQKEEFEHRFRDLNHSIKNFHAINTHIQKSVDIREVLRLAAEGLHEILGYDRVNILMVNAERNRLDFVASRGTGGEVVAGVTLPIDERAGAIYKVVHENRLLLIDDINRMPEEFHLKPPCDIIQQLRSRSFILCPIVVRNEVVGVFGVDNKVKRKKLDDTDVDTVKLFADQVSSTLIKISLLDAVETLIRELEYTFQELLKYRGDYTRHDHSLRRATGSTTEAIRDIAGGADVIREAVDTTRSAAGEISVSVEQVSQNLHHLTDFMEKSISAMAQISTTIKSIQENGVKSHTMSETVKQQAEVGAGAVANALEGLNGIARGVDGTFDAIERLVLKGEEVDSITGVIAEITRKTNLLALNASIIAAQAGEHGRSFGVVADEVRNLAQEAANSTGAIAQIIAEIKEYTNETGGHINRTRDLVREGISLGEGVETSLSQILDSSALAMEMTLEIRRATQEVGRSAEFVTRSIEQLGEMSSHISLSSREQTHGIRSIVKSIEEIKNMVDDMAEATDRQKQNTMEIEGAVTAVSDMAKRIFTELEERQQGSGEVIERLERLKQVGGANA